MCLIFQNRGFFIFLVLCYANPLFAQMDYSQMENWAYHPDKSGTLIDGYNMDVAVIDENLDTQNVFEITNNAMTDTGIDVFFVHPTILSDLSEYTTRENIPLDEQPTFLISASILGQAGLLSKYGRFFAPRYRQATPPTFIGSPSDNTQADVIGVAYQDVKSAFLYYLNNHNNGNKIILASHSQGAYLTAILLRDVFDDDEELQDQLVTAVLAGTVNTYAEAAEFAGGWWQNIPLCTTLDECSCIMSWRSFKEGQTLPFVGTSLPCLNPFLAGEGLVYSLLDVSEDRVLQDSIYYNNQQQPVRNYLIPKTDQPYGGNVGFVAFDSLYQIRHLRQDRTKVGFMVEHHPKPNDQRPDDLLDEESKPLFNLLGYHYKDYNIYLWAVMEQIDMKLAACELNIGVDKPRFQKPKLQMFPNPSSFDLHFKSDEEILKIEWYNLNGQLVKTIVPRKSEVTTSINQLPNGIYFLKVNWIDDEVWMGKLIKE